MGARNEEGTELSYRSASLCSLAACRYDNPVPPRFQATIDLWWLGAGISEQSMGARNRVGIGLSYRLARGGNLSPAIWGLGSRNQVGIGLSYRPASLCSLVTQFQAWFLESIPRPIAGLKFPTLAESIHWNRFLSSLKVYKYRLCCCTNASTSVSIWQRVDAWLKKQKKQATYQWWHFLTILQFYLVFILWVGAWWEGRDEAIMVMQQMGRTNLLNINWNYTYSLMDVLM